MDETWAPVIAVHAVAASLSLLFGAFQLLRRKKGGALHKVIGRVWVAAMYLVIFTSFGIRTLNGGFTWLHALSVLTFVTVTVGLWSAIKGRIHAHKSFMRGSYFGILGAFGGVIAVPSRRIPQMAILDLPNLIMWIAGLCLFTFAVIGTTQLVQGRNAKRHAKVAELMSLQSECEAALKRRYGTSDQEKHLDELIIVRNLASEDMDLTTMRVMAQFCERHSAMNIRSVVGVLRKFPAGVDELRHRLSDAHFEVHHALMLDTTVKVYDHSYHPEMKPVEKSMHVRRLIAYALTHIGDGWLIERVVRERNILHYDTVLEVVADMKSSGSASLAEGAL